MGKVLYIQASPRKKRSRSIKVADAFIEAYTKKNQGDTIDKLNLFDLDMPILDEDTLNARYSLLHGEQPDKESSPLWREVEHVVEHFVSADKYVLASPMWNFGIPYRLKWYFDTIIQPGYTFRIDPQKGYVGLVTGKPIVLIHASGGDYSTPETAALNLERVYIEQALGFIGFRNIETITVAPTIATGPQTADEVTRIAIAAAFKLAETF